MAAITGDLLALLDKIPTWKRVQETPARMDALVERVEELERRLERAPGTTCDACGALAMRLTKQGRVLGGHANHWSDDTWTCADCGHSEIRTRKTG
jgi:hypothetical protein